MSFSKSEIKDARKKVENIYGSNLESKASDEFCVAFGLIPNSLAMSDFAESLPTVQTRAAVLEFSPEIDKLSEIQKNTKKLRKNKDWSKLQKIVREFPLTEEVLFNSSQMLRQSNLKGVREDFYKKSGAIYNEIERSARGFQPGLEATALPTVPSSVTEICWLNKTMRTWVNPHLLAEVVADKNIERVDLPRRLEAEIQVTMQTINVPQYRQKFNHTGKGIIVAVIDSEVALQHPALKDRVIHKHNYSKELWGNPGFHGTAVAGIIASNDAAGTFVGVAPEATIYNYKVLATNKILNSDDFSGALAIQQALEDGAHVANCSWGAGVVSDGVSREARACDTAWALGMIIVKSAGNRGFEDGMLTTPADADGIIVVGATDQAGTNWQGYSSSGPARPAKNVRILSLREEQ